MPYTADISRNNPGCFLFLIDQSASMSGALAGQPDLRKMDGAADAVNKIVDAISQRCSQGMDIRDYFDIGILGYGHGRKVAYDPAQVYSYMDENEEWHQLPHDQLDKENLFESIVVSVLPGTSLERPFLPISQVAEVADLEERQVKEPDGTGGVVEVTRKVPVWLRPTASFETPMCAALSTASKAIQGWTSQHPDSYPPMVINISDGDATDGNPEPVAREIKALGTNDGNALLYNAHLSEMSATPVQYLAEDSGLPQDEYAARMFRMSSEFPAPLVDLARRMELPVTQGSRGYVYNADMVALVRFLDIGTRAASDLH